MNDLEEIRSRINIEELVAQYCQLKKSGRNFKANCPFHQEKTPSFIISPDKGLAYCFGCRKGGDIFAFFQQIENVDFPEAVKTLAERAGVQLQQTSSAKPDKSEKEIILKLIQAAHHFFQDHLTQSEVAQKYLEARGYHRDAQKMFGLGFAPDSFHELTEYLQKKGFTSAQMLDAGLAAQKNIGDSNVYDRFRNRVIFPIHDPAGTLVAFGGRALSSDDPAKYLNSPETKYYHKGLSLYCFHLAKQAIREKDQAIVVEGYFDALSCQRMGYHHTVASLGTALTDGQIKLLGRFTKNFLFAFDADVSGQSAASRSIELAQRLGYNVSVILIPANAGKDPDEALRGEPKEWENAVRDAVPATEYEFQKAFSVADVSTVGGKKQIGEILLPIIKRLPNAVEQEHYLKKLSLQLDTSLKAIMAEFAKQKESPVTLSQSLRRPPAPEPPHPEPYSRVEHFLGLLLNHPGHMELVKSLVKPEYLIDEKEKELYKTVVDHYNLSAGQKGDKNQEGGEMTRLRLLELYGEEKYRDFSQDELKQEIESYCVLIRADYQKRRLRDLTHQLEKPESDPRVALLKQEHQQLTSGQF
ncbi:MAG: DNA primase [bacterium]|nr:DNA primase [bacterium]